jgi:coenzyme F420-reducing hydrogenase delta subunit
MAVLKNIIGCKISDPQKNKLLDIVEDLKTNKSELLRDLIDNFLIEQEKINPKNTSKNETSNIIS